MFLRKLMNSSLLTHTSKCPSEEAWRASDGAFGFCELRRDDGEAVDEAARCLSGACLPWEWCLHSIQGLLRRLAGIYGNDISMIGRTVSERPVWTRSLHLPSYLH